MNLEIKVVPQDNGKFNILLLNTKDCLLIDSTKDVDYAKVGDEVQTLLKRFF